jgi:hypothetical protein
MKGEWRIAWQLKSGVFFHCTRLSRIPATYRAPVQIRELQLDKGSIADLLRIGG